MIDKEAFITKIVLGVCAPCLHTQVKQFDSYVTTFEQTAAQDPHSYDQTVNNARKETAICGFVNQSKIHRFHSQ